MPDIVVMQIVILIAAVALMAFTTYSALKLRASERAADRELARHDAGRGPAE